jgi:hypothetical protein
MPLQKIRFKPGINREGTSLANEGGWFDGDKIRFRSGYPEKIGGWTANSFNTFLGVCRSLWNWVTLGQYNLLGVGTNVKFYVEQGGVYNDITPLRLTTTNTTTFTLGKGSLNAAINDFQTTIQLFTATGAMPVEGDIVLIDYEQILYTQRVGTNLLGCIRGYNGTTAAAHAAGARVASSTIKVVDTAVTDIAIGDFVTYSGSQYIDPGIQPTVSTVNNTFSITAPQYQPRNNDTCVIFSWSSAVSGLALLTTYYVVNAVTTSGTVFQLADTKGGIPIDFLSSGSNLRIVFNNQTSIPEEMINQEYQIIGFGALSGGYLPYYIRARGYVAGNTFANNGAPIAFGASSATFGNGGGAVVSTYQINVGAETQTVGTGWGAGPWNDGAVTDSWAHGWGTGFSSGIPLQLRLWNQINFGEQLLFGYRNGPLYYYTVGGGSAPTYTRGNLVSGIAGATEVPAQVSFFTVSDATRIVICFGCTSYSFDTPASTFDPLLIRWSEQESYTKWLPSTTNQAGSYRLSHGSQIITALQTRQEILVWTDSAVYSMQYLGPPFIWGFNLLADNISVMSQNAVATAAGITYWMGVDKFYAYTGRVETLPCSVRQFIFSDLNRDQAGQIFAGTNEGYNEVWWFYCSAGSTVVDKYVIFNHLDRVWYYGTLSRTAWLDSPLRLTPMAATYNNIVVFHESGVDDGDVAAGETPKPIYSYIQSSDFDIDDGDRYSFVWRMIPDITFDGSTTPSPFTPSADFTLLPKQNPGAGYGPYQSPTVAANESYAVRHTYTVQEFTEIVYTRVRGRVISFKVASNTLGSQWQLGTPSIDIRKDGRR